MKQLDQLKYISNGVLRDFVRRVNIASDEHWWRDVNSPWKVQVMHSWSSFRTFTPDYWLERALDLCEKDIVVSRFGLGLNDLMKMDVCTFQMVEDRVHKILQRQKENLPKDIKDALEAKG